MHAGVAQLKGLIRPFVCDWAKQSNGTTDQFPGSLGPPATYWDRVRAAGVRGIPRQAF